MNPPSMRRSLGATVRIRLIQALVKSLGKRNFNLVNGQVFHLRFGRLERRDQDGNVIDIRIQAGFHFGHASRLSTDEPLMKLVITKDQWANVQANVDEINGYLYPDREVKDGRADLGRVAG